MIPLSYKTTQNDWVFKQNVLNQIFAPLYMPVVENSNGIF